MDVWHGMLLSAVGALSTAIGVMWAQNVRLRKQLDHVHLDRAEDARVHIADVKELTKETIALARAATYAPPLLRSAPPALDSKD